MKRYFGCPAQVRALVVGLVVLVGLAGASARRAWLGGLVHAAGIVNFIATDDEFIGLAKQTHAILIPTLTVVGGYGRMMHGVADRKPPAVDDPNGCVDRATLARVAE